MLLAAVAAATAITGVSVFVIGGNLGVRLDLHPGLIPPERHLAALAVACYHMAAYASAVAASVALCVWVGVERERRSRLQEPEA